MAIKKIWMQCKNCGYALRIARPKNNEKCPACGKHRLFVLQPGN